jgi:hypothetical protein
MHQREHDTLYCRSTCSVTLRLFNTINRSCALLIPFPKVSRGNFLSSPRGDSRNTYRSHGRRVSQAADGRNEWYLNLSGHAGASTDATSKFPCWVLDSRYLDVSLFTKPQDVLMFVRQYSLRWSGVTGAIPARPSSKHWSSTRLLVRPSFSLLFFPAIPTIRC